MYEFNEDPTSAASGPISLMQVAIGDETNPTARQISARGGLPLLVGDSILAEVSNGELTEGLAAANELSDAELSQICGELASRLRDTLNHSEPSDDLVETASDAAALFVLCLRHYGITDIGAIGHCSLEYDAASCRLELKQTA